MRNEFLEVFQGCTIGVVVFQGLNLVVNQFLPSLADGMATVVYRLAMAGLHGLVNRAVAPLIFGVKIIDYGKFRRFHVRYFLAPPPPK